MGSSKGTLRPLGIVADSADLEISSTIRTITPDIAAVTDPQILIAAAVKKALSNNWDRLNSQEKDEKRCEVLWNLPFPLEEIAASETLGRFLTV